MRVLILLALLGAAVAVPRNGERIVGGTPTDIQTYPYISNMQYLYWGFFWSQACGGSLITSQAVMSAAHCYVGDLPSQWRVRLGTSMASSGGSVHAASQLIIHPQYNSITMDHDIAIVHLATPAVLSDIIGVVGIAGANYNLADNTVVTAVGWGTLTPQGASPEQLQHVDVNIIDQNYCARQYAYLKSQPGFQNYPDVTDNMLCAGIQYIGGRDACQGDSGGPLVHSRFVQVGITSWGYSCAHPDYPGVNVRVNRYLDWILANA